MYIPSLVNYDLHVHVDVYFAFVERPRALCIYAHEITRAYTCTVPDIHTITVLLLTTVYFVSEVHVHCTSNVHVQYMSIKSHHTVQ